MEFPDAPPVFGLLTLQLYSVCVHLSPRFTVYCVGLTSGRHRSQFYFYPAQSPVLIQAFLMHVTVL